MDKLKPCPFCGGEAELTSRRVNSGQTLYRYRCASCHAAIGRWHGGISGYDYTAAETWNTRAERTCQRVSSAIEVGEVNGHKIAIPEYRCGECNRWLSDADKYCPNCGAKVIGG